MKENENDTAEAKAIREIVLAAQDIEKLHLELEEAERLLACAQDKLRYWTVKLNDIRRSQ